MPAPRSLTTYTAALHRNSIYADVGVQRDIPMLLHPDEEVLLVLPGVDTDHADVMIVTERRFLLAEVTGTSTPPVVQRWAPARAVRSAEYRPVLLARVRVRCDGQPDILMMPYEAHDAERFVAELSHLLRTGRLPG